jgi:acyl carrier protein
LLWFINTSGGLRLHESHEIEPIRERVLDIVCENLGVNRETVTDLTSFQADMGLDSLDTVELVMLLEEEFDMTIPDDHAEKITTIAEAVDYIARSGLE